MRPRSPASPPCRAGPGSVRTPPSGSCEMLKFGAIFLSCRTSATLSFTAMPPGALSELKDAQASTARNARTGMPAPTIISVRRPKGNLGPGLSKAGIMQSSGRIPHRCPAIIFRVAASAVDSQVVLRVPQVRPRRGQPARPAGSGSRPRPMLAVYGSSRPVRPGRTLCMARWRRTPPPPHQVRGRL